MKRLIGIALIALMVVSIGGVVHAGVFDWFPIKWGDDKDKGGWHGSCLGPAGAFGGPGGGPGTGPNKCKIDYKKINYNHG